MASTALRYCPRAMVSLTAAVEGSDQLVTTKVVPSSVNVTRKPHTHADEARVEVLGSALPFDPRQIESLAMVIWLGDVAGINDDVSLSENNIRFASYVDTDEDERSDKGPRVELVARDMSGVLRDAKKWDAKAAPRYSDTLESAISKILMEVPGAEQLEIDLPSDLQGVTLGKAANKKTATGPIPLPKAQCSAWEAIEAAAGIIGLLVDVDMDTIRLRTPASVFGDTSNPESTKPAYSFVFGTEKGNLLSVRRRKRFLSVRKGVRVVSFDPDSRSILEQDWPPDGALPPRKRPPIHKRTKKPSKTAPKAIAPPERDIFRVPGLHTKDAALTVAKRIWTERAKQEIEGEIVTPLWDADLLNLKNGDRIIIKIAPDIEAELQRTNDDEKKIRFLQSRLMIEREAARVLIRASQHRPSDLFYVKQVHFSWRADGAPSVSINFLNLIVL